jgi:hypothetical protein
MNVMKYIKKWKLFVGAFVWVFATSCQNDDFFDPVPYVPVDIVINLTNQEFAPLRLDKGHVDILGGSRGIIIYRETANSYKAFDKHSPYRSQEICAIVDVHPSGFYITEACEGLSFDFNGNPLDGAPFILRQYVTRLDGDFLYITNE